MKRRTAIYCILAFLVLLAGCRREESPAEDPVPEVSSVIHYVAHVEGPDIRGTVPTRATLDGDGKYVFQAGDRLYLEYREDEAVKMYGTLDLPAEDVGKTMAAFEGDLNCIGGFEPGSTLMLDATLVSASDEIHTWTDDMLTGVDYSDTWAGSLSQAVEKHSHFTGRGGFRDKVFILNQNSSFINFVISDIEGVAAGDDVSVSLSQGGSDMRSVTVSATAAGQVSFTLAFPGGTVFDGVKFSIGVLDNLSINDITLAANRFYTVERSLVETDAFTIEAVEDGTVITFALSEGVQYSVDMGFSWWDYDGSGVSLDEGETVSFRVVRSASYDRALFTSSDNKPCYIYGNMMSLYCNDGYSSYKTAVPASAFKNAFKNMTFLRSKSGKKTVLGAGTLGNNCYQSMFEGCTGLTEVPITTLPATTLPNSCYYLMFSGCSAMTGSILLGNTGTGVVTIGSDSCRQMFSGCTALNSVTGKFNVEPKGNCCWEMFNGCTNLSAVPVFIFKETAGTGWGQACRSMFKNCTRLEDADVTISVTSAASSCFREMFYGCSSLTTAPSLSSLSTLATGCCYQMFYGCSALTTAPDLTATILANTCYTQMFYGCSALTTGPLMGNNDSGITSVDDASCQQMFTNCSALVSVTGKLNAEPRKECYKEMFYGCSNLTTAPTVIVKETSGTGWTNACRSMFKNCTSLATPSVTISVSSLEKECFYEMFYGCSALTSAPSLVGVSTLAVNCCRDMFNKCSSLTAMPPMPAATLMSESCFYQMFAECTSLTTVTSLPGTTLAKNCYYRFFWHDTGITTVPSDFLPATTMAEGCYTSMFDGCTSLTAAPALPATTLAKSCYSIMFWGCTGLTAAPDLPATSLVESCYSQMFESCSNLRSITCLATSTATNATKDWLKNARNNADCTFTYDASATFWTTGQSSIPSNWTRIAITP